MTRSVVAKNLESFIVAQFYAVKKPLETRRGIRLDVAGQVASYVHERSPPELLVWNDSRFDWRETFNIKTKKSALRKLTLTLHHHRGRCRIAADGGVRLTDVQARCVRSHVVYVQRSAITLVGALSTKARSYIFC